MLYALLFVGAVGQTPAQLGVYETMAGCQDAIRKIYLYQATPRGVDLPPAARKLLANAVDEQLKYQQKYQCLPRPR